MYKKSDSGYWKARMEALEDEQYRRSMAYYKDVQEQFREASNSLQMDIEHWYQRLAENNDVSYAGAKKLLKKGELDEFKWTVERYVKAGEENAVNRRWMKELENASARYHISYLEAMKLQVQQHAELLSAEYESGMTDFLHRSFGGRFYRTAFEISKGTGVGFNLSRLDERKVDALIRHPWARDGKNFSDRIWTNKEKLVNNLHTELTQNIIRGASPKQAIDRLAKTMDVSQAQAGRLVMTESAAIASAAQKDALKELGVEQYEILATLDNRTSEICRELDGKVFDMKDYEVGVTAPPFHPRCRSTTVPYFDDEFTTGGQRAARNPETGKTVYVPANITYKDWEVEYVKKKEQISMPDSLKLKGQPSEPLKNLYFKEIAMIPVKHIELIEAAVDKVIVDPEHNSRYDREKGIVYLSEKLEEGETIHEMAHALETKLGLYQNREFIEVLKSGLDTLAWKDIIYVPNEYGKPVCFLSGPKLISEYQGRMYEGVEFWDDEGSINPYSLADYFAEGYREFILHPDNLKIHDKRLYDYIKGIAK